MLNPNNYHLEGHHWQLGRKLPVNCKRCKIRVWYNPPAVPGPVHLYWYEKRWNIEMLCWNTCTVTKPYVCLFITKNYRFIGPSWQITIFLHPGPGYWLLAGANLSWVKRGNSVHHQPWSFWILCNDFWAKQCASSFSMTNAATVEWT